MINISGLIVQQMIDKNIIDTQDKELYNYGIKSTINILINILTAICIGVCMHKLITVLVFLSSFITLRTFTGGYHSKRKLTCYILSNSLIFILCVIINYISINKNKILGLCILLFAIYTIHKLSPMGSISKPLDDTEIIFFKKMVNIILTLQTLLLSIFYYFKLINYTTIILFSFIIISILLILSKMKFIIISKFSKI